MSAINLMPHVSRGRLLRQHTGYLQLPRKDGLVLAILLKLSCYSFSYGERAGTDCYNLFACSVKA